MSQQFNTVRVGGAGRDTFDLSHHQVTTTDFGFLIPICMRHMVPNDDFVVKPHLFCRLAPLAFPAYGRITCRVHSFFVPYRVMFAGWNQFIEGKTNQLPPYLTAGTIRNVLANDPQFVSGGSSTRGKYGRIMANLGLNPSCFTVGNNVNDNERINIFPLMAYYKIWMDYFMDTNLNDHAIMDQVFKGYTYNGGNMSAFATTLLQTRSVCFKKDYFTTAKVHPQQGQNPSTVGTDFDINLNPGLAGGSAGDPVRISGFQIYRESSSSSSVPSGSTSVISSFTVEDLRVATSYQRYLERNNYVGTKIQNQILVHFGIIPPALRLDQAEYIGGSNFPIQIGDVTSSAPTSSTSGDVKTVGLGAQAGKGIGAAKSETVRYHAKEHGVFMTVLSVLPDTAYYQGISKFWTKGVTGDPLDFYTPEFENLGFQEVLNKELYVPERDVSNDYPGYDPDGIWGYTPRYSEYKFQNSVLAGDFVGNLSGGSSVVMGSLMDSWHLFRKLFYDANNPLALNDNFVTCDNRNNDFDRVFQETDNKLDHFYFNIDVDVKATRPMVGFAEPSLDAANHSQGKPINIPYGGTRL